MTDFQITECMITSGGSFVVALGKLFRIADPDNRDKLKATFAGYFANYAALAEIAENRAHHESYNLTGLHGTTP